jgi:hypothetical protein
MNKKFEKIAVVVALVIAAGSAAQAASTDSLTSAGYTQNFSAMGTGSAFPDAGWTAYNITTGDDSHYQWTSSIAAGDVGGGTQITTVTAITDTAITGSTKSGSAVYNIGDTVNGGRALGESPTGDDGIAQQLILTNNTGKAISSLNISYQIAKFTDGVLQSSTDSTLPKNEELPGYQLFYSVNGGAYTNVSQFNPVASNVANPNNQPVIPVGTPAAAGTSGTLPLDYSNTQVSGTVTLAQAVAAGQTITFRWVDDNGVNVSPDQVIGLENVSINAATPTPIPAAAWLLGSGLMGLFGMRRRKQS